MQGFSPKLPVSEADRQWVDEGFRRLENLIGRRRMLDARVVLARAEDFPDLYDQTPAAAEILFHRVCAYMQVDHRQVEFEVFPDETEQLIETVPHWSSHGDGGLRAAGLFVDQSIDNHPPEQVSE